MTALHQPQHQLQLQQQQQHQATLINNQNQLNSLINEIKKFRNYTKQLNLLLDETLNAYKELKSLQNINALIGIFNDQGIKNTF